MTDTTTGIHEEIVNESAIIDAAETGKIIDGLALELDAAGTVLIFAGNNYCGVARIEKGTSAGVAQAVAGERIAILKKGIHEVYDSEDDVLEIGDPLKPTGTAGEYRLWVDGVDSTLILAGFLERTKDANKKILMKINAGGR